MGHWNANDSPISAMARATSAGGRPWLLIQWVASSDDPAAMASARPTPTVQ